MRPKWAGGPANRPDGPLQSLRRRVWAARVFALSVPDAFEKHFFNGLLRGRVIEPPQARNPRPDENRGEVGQNAVHLRDITDETLPCHA
ncbi:hypothetical protein Ajs_3612 [Acidovorax sp. JS42]|nr:hypothetical protein Ajs_3612 [Acidovorax sp. JS42]